MFEQTFKNIDDILYKDAGADSELDYTEQSSWILFLRYLDELELEKQDEAELKGEEYSFILDEKHRWANWIPCWWKRSAPGTAKKNGAPCSG